MNRPLPAWLGDPGENRGMACLAWVVAWNRGLAAAWGTETSLMVLPAKMLEQLGGDGISNTVPPMITEDWDKQRTTNSGLRVACRPGGSL